MNKRLPLLASGLVVAVALTTSACGAGGGSSSSGPVVFGATLSLTGSLGSIGGVEKLGYQQYVADVNAKGGIDVGGKKRKVELRVLDNRSDPTTASQQASQLVLKDDAVALLGACTPPITVPVGLVAEKERVPYVTSCTPTTAFAQGNKSGWQYSWDFFFGEDAQAALAFKGADQVKTNKKVAIFTDTEPDGVVERVKFKAAAKKAGYSVVGDYTFPVGTSDFASFINEAKTKGAQVVVAQMVPPDGVAMVKQMKSLVFKPRFIVVEKAGDTPTWTQSLGKLAEGTVHQWFWSPTAGYPGAADLQKELEAKKLTEVSDQGIAIACYTVAAVVGDAIDQAGTTDAGKVNAAIKATDKTYPFGPIKFGSDHTQSTSVYLAQYQHGTSVQIVPQVAGVQVQVPPAGLQ